MSDSSHPPPDQKPTPPTLFQYIEENHKLITTLGVFTALTLFSRQIANGTFANLLSVLSLTLSLIIWLELSGRFPSKMGTARLYWFESVLGFTVMTLTVYWFLSTRSVFPWLTLVLTFIGTSYLLSAIAKRHDLFNRLFKAHPGQRKGLRYVLGIILLALMVAISILAASLVAMYLDPLLGTPTDWLSVS